MAYLAVNDNPTGSWISGSIYDENGQKIELSHISVDASLYEICNTVFSDDN